MLGGGGTLRGSRSSRGRGDGSNFRCRCRRSETCSNNVCDILLMLVSHLPPMARNLELHLESSPPSFEHLAQHVSTQD